MTTNTAAAAEIVAEIAAIAGGRDGRLNLWTATRVYRMNFRTVDGARLALGCFQPLNPKTGQPWQAQRYIGIQPWFNDNSTPADKAAAIVAAHIVAAKLAVLNWTFEPAA